MIILFKFYFMLSVIYYYKLVWILLILLFYHPLYSLPLFSKFNRFLSENSQIGGKWRLFHCLKNYAPMNCPVSFLCVCNVVVWKYRPNDFIQPPKTIREQIAAVWIVILQNINFLWNFKGHVTFPPLPPYWQMTHSAITDGAAAFILIW